MNGWFVDEELVGVDTTGRSVRDEVLRDDGGWTAWLGAVRAGREGKVAEPPHHLAVPIAVWGPAEDWTAWADAAR